MTYKCLPGDIGVDISLNQSSVFKFESKTHIITSLGGNRVRMTRRIDNTHDIYDSPISNFVDLNGVPIATDFASLVEYFTREAAFLQAGEGIAVDGKKVSVVAGGPSTLGGYKVGTGLMVDGTGKLSATASSEVTKVLSTQAEMLALAAEPLRPYRVIRLDTKKLYYLNAGATPSVLASWFTGPSIEAAVVSFKGRAGAVEPSVGDYNQDIVQAIDKSTATAYKFVMNNGKLFIEDVVTQERREVANQESLTGFDARFTTLTDIVNNEVDGLVKRVTALEQAPPPEDFGNKILALQVKDEELNSLILAVDNKVDSTAANTVVLDQRVSQLEERPTPKDYTAEINAIKSVDLTQDSKIISIEAQMLNKATVVNGKIPYELLPEFPVGRKVNVANRAARLALSAYPDLTIAYESDTGDAWGLDSNANPAISSNWSKLGNAQAIGVSSFNGRSGSVGPQAGDYSAGQITELVTKRFVSSDQITKWDASADATVIKSFKGRTGAVTPSAGDYTSDLITETTNKQFISATDKALISSINARVTAIEAKLNYVRTWKTYNITTERVQNTWYTNTSPREIIVDAHSNTVSNFVFLKIEMKANASASVFSLNSNNANGSVPFTAKISGEIPAGWMYRITDNSTGSVRTVARWAEFS